MKKTENYNVGGIQFQTHVSDKTGSITLEFKAVSPFNKTGSDAISFSRIVDLAETYLKSQGMKFTRVSDSGVVTFREFTALGKAVALTPSVLLGGANKILRKLEEEKPSKDQIIVAVNQLIEQCKNKETPSDVPQEISSTTHFGFIKGLGDKVKLTLECGTDPKHHEIKLSFPWEMSQDILSPNEDENERRKHIGVMILDLLKDALLHKENISCDIKRPDKGPGEFTCTIRGSVIDLETQCNSRIMYDCLLKTLADLHNEFKAPHHGKKHGKSDKEKNATPEQLMAAIEAIGKKLSGVESPDHEHDHNIEAQVVEVIFEVIGRFNKNTLIQDDRVPPEQCTALAKNIWKGIQDNITPSNVLNQVENALLAIYDKDSQILRLLTGELVDTLTPVLRQGVVPDMLLPPDMATAIRHVVTAYNNQIGVLEKLEGQTINRLSDSITKEIAEPAFSRGIGSKTGTIVRTELEKYFPLESRHITVLAKKLEKVIDFIQNPHKASSAEAQL